MLTSFLFFLSHGDHYFEVVGDGGAEDYACALPCGVAEDVQYVFNVGGKHGLLLSTDGIYEEYTLPEEIYQMRQNESTI